MGFKFRILSTASEPQKDGDTYIRYIGNVEPFRRGDQMQVKKIGVEVDGSSKLQFNTGLNENKIPFLSWLTPEQKEEHKKLLSEYKPIIEEYLGGDINDTNKYIWQKPERNTIMVDNETLNQVFDTKNIEHAILYFNIMSGAFMDLIAPIKDMADNPKYSASLYLVHENEVNDDVADDYSTKGDAYANLKQLHKDESGDALLYIAWALQKNTKGFGAYTRSTPKSELLKYHGEFIEGKLTKTKRNTPKDFVDITERWLQGGKVREAIQVEAYVKAADYYSYLNTNKENRYELPSGVTIGASVEDAVDNIRKPKNTKELESLRNFVESKWKE